jgi:RimJ/RimL family protein N-acetyltransferase
MTQGPDSRERPLTTDRLILAPRTIAEVRDELARLEPADRAQLSAAWLAQLDDPRVGTWTLGFTILERARGTRVGSCGFKGPPDGRTVEIAYAIDPAHRGRGYATEAALALLAYAFAADDVDLVRAHTLPDGAASIAVLSRCGFVRVGEVVDPEDGVVVRWERRRERTVG